AAHKRQVCFGHGKVCVDRIEPLNREQHCAATAPAAASHDVPSIDKPQTSPSIDRRADIAIIEIHLGSRHRAFRSFYRSLVAFYGCLSSVQILRRDHVPSAQFLLTLKGNLIKNQFRLRLSELT